MLRPHLARWSLYKQAIREAARLARNKDLNKFPDAPWARAMTLRSVARCVWHNDVGAAHCLIRKSKTAKAFLV
eukprot:6404393-Alexandrium_andersonii.AAC.1